MVHPVFIQAFYYGVVMLLSVAILGFLLRGFFWKYLKVRVSFGKLVLVKIRSILRDHYAIGRVEDGFLIYTVNDIKGKVEKRIHLPNKTKKGEDFNPFYRSLSVYWVDVDEEKNSIANLDFKGVEGFDAKKYSDLLTRALMRPSIDSGKEKLIFALIVIIAIGLGINLYLTYTILNKAGMIELVVNALKDQAIATVRGSTGI